MSATPSHVPDASGQPPSSVIELLFADFEPEHSATRRLLQRFPEGRGDWHPHERSRTLAQLATHVADLPNRGVTVLTTTDRDVAGRQPPSSVATAAELLSIHDAGVAQLHAELARTDLAALSVEWVIRHGAQVLARGPRRVMLRTVMMSHLIHHRAQLGVYYRLLDIPVPGMYGPSADDIAARGTP